MKHLPAIFIMLMMALCSCSHGDKSVSPLFRWRAISPATDSAVVALEEGFIAMVPADTLIRLISILEQESATSTDGRQLLCRYYFWRGRIANREHSDPLQDLRMARQLCDSAKYPYDHLRISYLEAILQSKNSQPEFYEKLKHFESYAVATGDHFMHASLLIDMGHVLMGTENTEHALANYLKADSIYRSLGVTLYHLKTSLNNVNILNKAGRREESVALCRKLLGNRHARNDFDFYNYLRLTAFQVTGDTTQLITGYNEIRNKNGYERRKLLFELALGHNALENGDIDKALAFTRLVTKHHITPFVAEHAEDIYELAHATYEIAGQPDSAYTYIRLLAQERERLLKENTAMRVTSIENNAEITRLEQEADARQKAGRTSMIISLLLVMLAAMAVVMILMRRSQRSRIALMESQLNLERSQRRMVSSSLAMTEKDNVLSAVLDQIGNLAENGRINPEECSGLQQSIRMHLSGRQEWADFQRMFEEVHPSFATTLKQRYPALSEGDLRLATYIKIGLPTKQIARMLLLQPDSVKKNRLRLRRRMGIARSESLEDILRSI